MLSPFGELMVNQHDEIKEVSEEGVHGPEPQLVPYTHEGDIEDAIADEAPHNNGTLEILIQGQKTTKAKALQHQMANHSSRSSTDSLKRVQQLSCFNSMSSRVINADFIMSSNGVLGRPSLRIGNPIAILVQCEGLVVLAMAQVNQLKFAEKDDLNELPIHLLANPTARVDSQILCLVPATIEDNPTLVHNWCWSLQMEVLCDNIPGQGVHPINPSLSVQKLGKPTFLFESTFLVTLSCNLFQELRQQDRRNQKNTQHVLEHMGAHILHDAKLNASKERCGLCLCPAPISPCSNVPVFCSLCKPGSPAVWTYSLHSHYCTRHRLNSVANFPKNGHVELSQSEKDGMKWVWGTCFNQWRSYFLKKGRRTSLAISEAH
ncbi:hypothetical protein EDB83DRAFT_2225333 [Lactarius deliciosus]|nr:hypothetical protein EDB83DRAFT_2225333 [Lactarius deliciosus]